MDRRGVVVAVAMGVAMLGSNLPAPLYELYRARLGFSTLAMTGVFAAYPLALVVTLLGLRGLPDRIGRVPVLALGLVAAGLGSACFLVGASLTWLVAGRLCAAVAIGAVGAAGPPLLIEVDRDGDRARAALAATVALSLACGVAPALSGALAVWSPLPLSLAYIVHLLVCALALAALARLRAPARPRVAGLGRLATAALGPEARRAWFAAALTSGIVWWLASLFVSLVPSYVGALLGARSPALQGALALVVFAVSPAAQFAARGRLDDVSCARLGLVATAVALAAILVAVPTRSLALFGLGTLVAGVAQGVGFYGAQAMVNRVAPPALRARLSAGFFALTYLAIGVPILAMGAIGASHGLFAAFLAAGIPAACLALVLAALVPAVRTVPARA